MIPNINFQLFSLIYSILFLIIYFSKPRLQTLENKIYRLLLILNILVLVLDITSVYTINNLNKINSIVILNMFVSKLYLVSLAMWILLFIFYFLVVIDNAKKEKNIYFNQLRKTTKSFFKLLFIIDIIAIFFIIILPLYFNNDNGIYSYGPSTIVLYILNPIMLIICLITIISNFKILYKQRIIPLLVFLILALILIPIQLFNPTLLLVSSVQTFVIILMYHTIENPDLKMLNQMELAKDIAEKANSAKSDFLSSMSHEIRTPLNAVIGLSELNKEAKNLEEAIQNSIDINTAAHILNEIVGNVLDMSKIESGNMEISTIEYNPYEIINNAINLVKYKFKEKNLNLNIKIAPDIPKNLLGDKVNLTKVILNLLTNAVKYTKKGHVTLTVNCINKNDISKLIIIVEDTGRGIKQEQIDKLFVKFERLEKDRNTTTVGTGLGLAITKYILELMGGKITVQSIYGSGSKFTVTLNQKIITNEPKEKYTQKTESLNLNDKKILLIDDNKLNLKVISRILKKYNCQTEEVLSGLEAINKIKEGIKFDLLLLDEMMPELSGTETMQILKKDNYKVPIVVLTADAKVGSKEKYLKIGYDDYLSKPVNIKELERVLKKYLKIKQ